MTATVFNYNDPVDFLNASLNEMQAKNPRFSLRAWAKQLGLTHVAMLSMVLSRKRKFLPSLSSKISEQFLKFGQFTQTEARYFDMLVLFSNSASSEERSFYQRILSELRPDREFVALDLDRIRFISDWYHIAILEMTFLKDFNSDPHWVSLRLGDDVTESQVKDAIERLIRLGLLKRSDGRIEKTDAQLESSNDIPNEALRNFHYQMIQKSLRALEKQNIQHREICSQTMAISRDRLPEAKRMIREFRNKMCKFLESDQNDAIYQLNVQLFDILEN